MSQMSRRDFIARGAALGAALPLGATLGAGSGAASTAAEVGPISVFSKHLQWLKFEELAEVVAEAGFEGIDLTVRPGGHVLPDRASEDLPRAVKAARDAGLTVPMITTAIMDPRDANTRRILAAAQAAGVEYYRMGYLRYPEGVQVGDALEKMRPLVRDLADLNERYEIHGAYQNHSGVGVGGPVWDLDVLLKGLDPRWLGVQYDIAHATVEGGMAWPLGLQLLSPYIRTIDIKDFLWVERGDRWAPRWVPVGEGMVDFPRYLEKFKQLGISAAISVHYEYAPLEGPNELAPPERRAEAVSLMRRDLQQLRAYLRDAGL